MVMAGPKWTLFTFIFPIHHLKVTLGVAKHKWHQPAVIVLSSAAPSPHLSGAERGAMGLFTAGGASETQKQYRSIATGLGSSVNDRKFQRTVAYFRYKFTFLSNKTNLEIDRNGTATPQIYHRPIAL